MQATARVILILCAASLPPSAAAVHVPERVLVFDAPGSLEGTYRLDGLRRVLLEFDEAHRGALDLDLEDASFTNATAEVLEAKEHDAGGGDLPGVALPDQTFHAGSGSLHLDLGSRGRSSLYIVAVSIQLAASGPGELRVKTNGTGLSAFYPDPGGSPSPLEEEAVPDGEAYLLSRAGGSDARIQVDGLVSAAWSNGEATCVGMAACPRGAGWVAHRVDLLPGPPAATYAKLTQVPHETIRPTSGRGVASGDASFLLAGGLSWSASLSGRARLPLASPTQACDGCLLPDGQTLQVSGEVRLSGLRARDAERMESGVGGDIQEARFDQQTVSPGLLAGAGTAVGVVATVGIVLLLFKLLGGAFLTRLNKDPLEHPRRARIHTYVRDHPGATFREVARETETATGTARHHLSMLKRHKLIVEHPHGGTMRFFENHGKFDTTWGSVVLLREEPLKQLHDWLAERPEAAQKEVLAAMARHGWGRSTTQHRLVRLAQGGLVSVRLQGRLKFYAIRTTVRPKPSFTPLTPAAS